MKKKILTKTDRHVMELVLNNPDKLNCMGSDMLRELESAVDHAASDRNVRALLFRGAGEKAFSTGADLKEFQSLSGKDKEKWIVTGNRIFNKIELLPKPTVAWIHGYAIGGGLELALACDFRIGTPSAVLASVELQHGWLPGWGGMARLRRLIGEAKAKEVIAFCEKIGAQKAVEAGLLTRVLDNDNPEKELESLLTHLTSLDPEAFRMAKSVLMDPGRSTGGSALEFDILAMQLADKKSE